MITLLIATRNTHKVQEIRAILGTEFRYLTLRDFPDAPEVSEDAPTFAGNATRKAVELAKWLSSSRNPQPAIRGTLPCFVLADDSGLEVDALEGAPGIYSARYAGKNATDEQNLKKLLTELAEAGAKTHQRKARFRCVIALTPAVVSHAESASPVCYADEFELQTELFEGTCEGRIEFAPRGPGGFGYDPLFVPQGYEQTFAELGEEVKNRLSHRGKALAKLKKRLLSVTNA